jgi:antitoxin (DNA-binding transcriptional repressor) of toxin-antitoxin stability system
MTLIRPKGTDWQIFSPMCRGVFYSLGRALTFVAAGGYYGHMKKASVSELKNQISRYLDYVKHGETVLVLDRMVPVAELKPVTGKSSSGKLVALERKGIIRLGSGEIPEKFFKEKLSGKRARILDALLEERENGR